MTGKRLLSIWFALAAASCATTGGPPETGQESEARENARINASLGQEYMTRGQMEIALEKLRKSVAADPHYAPGQTLLAMLYDRIGEPELANRHYRLAVEAAPRNGDVNNNYGVFLCQKGEADKAIPYFLQAVEDPFYRTPAVAFANAGSCMLQTADLDKAERFLRQSLEYDAEFPDTLLYLAEVHERRGEYLGARAFLQRYESTGTESAQGYYLGYRVEMELGNERAAGSYRDHLLSKFSGTEEARKVRENR